MSANADGQRLSPSPEDQLQFDEISLNMAPVHPMSYVLTPAEDAILSSSSAEQSPASGTSPTATVSPVAIAERIYQCQQQQRQQPTEATDSEKIEATDPAKGKVTLPETLPNPSGNTQQMSPAQQSPPPIYSAIYPPGTHPAAPSGHIPQLANCTPTYIIDANAIRSGRVTDCELSPTLLVHGTAGVLKPVHLATPPLLIFADPFGEFARRRRALAALSLLLLFFPMVALLLIVWSMNGLNSVDSL
ncbi:hypothetical protein niasHT_023865 [Heterodera trifolii]|uniref:Uncharacterized protein n=1 Tax=Heterodera trifolii TaxID=157864 RepID=A0ABD2JCH1_9BILA